MDILGSVMLIAVRVIVSAVLDGQDTFPWLDTPLTH